MSHDHYLECRACGDRQSHDDFRRAVNCYSADELVKNALAVNALVSSGVAFEDGLKQWAYFIAQHAACNAFYEICEYGNYGSDPCSPDERVEVKGAEQPSCVTCHGRRLVPCPDCKEEEK